MSDATLTVTSSSNNVCTGSYTITSATIQNLLANLKSQYYNYLYNLDLAFITSDGILVSIPVTGLSGTSSDIRTSSILSVGTHLLTEAQTFIVSIDNTSTIEVLRMAASADILFSAINAWIYDLIPNVFQIVYNNTIVGYFAIIFDSANDNLMRPIYAACDITNSNITYIQFTSDTSQSNHINFIGYVLPCAEMIAYNSQPSNSYLTNVRCVYISLSAVPDIKTFVGVAFNYGDHVDTSKIIQVTRESGKYRVDINIQNPTTPLIYGLDYVLDAFLYVTSTGDPQYTIVSQEIINQLEMLTANGYTYNVMLAFSTLDGVLVSIPVTGVTGSSPGIKYSQPLIPGTYVLSISIPFLVSTTDVVGGKLGQVAISSYILQQAVSVWINNSPPNVFTFQYQISDNVLSDKQGGVILYDSVSKTKMITIYFLSTPDTISPFTPFVVFDFSGFPGTTRIANYSSSLPSPDRTVLQREIYVLPGLRDLIDSGTDVTFEIDLPSSSANIASITLDSASTIKEYSLALIKSVNNTITNLPTFITGTFVYYTLPPSLLLTVSNGTISGNYIAYVFSSSQQTISTGTNGVGVSSP